MGQFLLLVVIALTVGAVVFGVTVLLTGGDRGLSPAEPDGRAVPLPGTRPLVESDIARVRFDTGARGYRMAQVDQAMRRAAYDIGYKDELINVLEAEVDALRSGRFSDAEVLRRAREAAQAATVPAAEPSAPAGDSDGATIELGAPAAATETAAVTASADDGDGTGSTAGAGDEGTTDPDAPSDDGDSDDGSVADDDEPVADDDEPVLDGDERFADEDGRAAVSGQPGAKSGGDAGGSDQPESDTVLPGRR
jgi:DivIVA domain-containing protein